MYELAKEGLNSGQALAAGLEPHAIPKKKKSVDITLWSLGLTTQNI
jgi:hypothetical protein